MLDWIKYIPYALDRSDKQTQIKGSQFSAAKPEEWTLSDSHFFCSVPKSRSIYGSESLKVIAQSKSPNRTNLNTINLSSFPSSSMPNQRWRAECFFIREWNYNGPWFSGHKANLGLRAVLLEASDTSSYEDSSFFHPKVFESAVADFLNSFFGHRKTSHKANFKGPINWKRVELSSSIKGACFDIEKLEGSGYQRFIIFPISHSRLVQILFDFDEKKESPYMPTMLELAESIIKTFKLEVGPQTLEEWKKVQQICPDMSLTDTFGSLKWPIKPSDVGKPQAGIEEPVLINRD